MKTAEQIQNERGFASCLWIGGFLFPPLWILAILYWLGGGGRD